MESIGAHREMKTLQTMWEFLITAVIICCAGCDVSETSRVSPVVVTTQTSEYPLPSKVEPGSTDIKTMQRIDVNNPKEALAARFADVFSGQIYVRRERKSVDNSVQR